MNYSVIELKAELTRRFADSADLSAREIILRSDRRTPALIITMEGMVDKEGLAQAAVNPLMSYSFGSKTPQKIEREILETVLEIGRAHV